MKLFIIVLIISLNVSANVASAQKVSINVKNAALRNVMQKIRQQTGYYFLFQSDLIKDAKPVSVNLVQSNLSDALDIIFKDQPFTWQFQDKGIVLTKIKPERSIIDKVKALFSAIDIKGKVTDQAGIPLPGASVKAGGKITVTNSTGEFSLFGIEENSTVEISYIGYKTLNVKASSGYLTISLQSAASDLSEVVINKGYYNIKSELNTGSTATLKAKDIEKQPISDPLMALSGRVTGLYINNTSGIPGAKVNVQLRGRNSLQNRNEPLFIVDGIPFNYTGLSQIGNAAGAGANALSPFTSIRPGDIESIDVLKDADATAIYGSRGANGVILITTKKGKAGKTAINFDVYSGAAVVARKFDLLNTSQYLEMRNEALSNSQATPRPNDYDVNGTYSKDKYTDWQKLLIGGTANTTDARGTVSGGNEQTQYLIGLGYRNEDFVYPGDFKNEIGSGNANITHTTENGRFNINLSLNYSINKNKLPITDLSQYIYLPPNAPDVYDAKGNLNWENNTFANNPFQWLLRKSTSETENLISNMVLSYKIVKGLQIKTNIGYNSIRLKELNILPYSAIMPEDGDDPNVYRGKNLGMNGVKSYIIEPQLNYTISRGNHHLDALLGTTFNESNAEGLIVNSSNFISDAAILNSSAALTTTSSNSSSQYRYNATYFRLGYNYDEKYVLNLTGRRDGSSRFGPGNKFGNFGSIGAAWLFHKEQWVHDHFSFLSMGKLRGSIGRTGNDQFPDYEYLSTYSNRTIYFGVSGLEPTRLTNAEYHWEVNNKSEGAMELGFLDNRLTTSVAYYRNRTGNQLVNYPLPRTTGFTGIRANLPAVVQNTGWEFEVNSQNIVRPYFNWTTSFNITIPKNKLVSYPNLEASTYANTYVVGQPLGVQLLYHYSGLNPNTGIYTFDDRNKDGSLGTADRIPVFVGQKFFGGLNNSFTYKRFQLDIFCQFVKQQAYKYFSVGIPGFLNSAHIANQPVYVLDRWRKPGDTGPYQQFVARGGDALTAGTLITESDAIVTDASFLRLKNVSLSYTLAPKWLDYFKIKHVSLYLHAQNVLTITNYKGLDPETAMSVVRGARPVLPPLRVLTAGFQLTF